MELHKKGLERASTDEIIDWLYEHERNPKDIDRKTLRYKINSVLSNKGIDLFEKPLKK